MTPGDSETVRAEAPRVFVPYEDPTARPRLFRRTVRVLLVTGTDEILLFCDSDPGLPDFRWWITPGGGIDPGESERQAAVREVAEETGWVITEEALRGPIARRHAVHGYSDQVVEQDEAYYLAAVPRFEVDISAHTEEEQLTLKGHRWWNRPELAETEAWIWPEELPSLWDLAARPERWPVDLGHQEESTLPDHATTSGHVDG